MYKISGCCGMPTPQCTQTPSFTPCGLQHSMPTVVPIRTLSLPSCVLTPCSGISPPGCPNCMSPTLCLDSNQWHYYCLPTLTPSCLSCPNLFTPDIFLCRHPFNLCGSTVATTSLCQCPSHCAWARTFHVAPLLHRPFSRGLPLRRGLWYLCWISLLCGHLPPHTWALASWQGSPNPYGNPLVLPLWLLPLCQAATAHHCRHLRGHSLQPTWIQTSCSTSMGKLTLLSSV